MLKNDKIDKKGLDRCLAESHTILKIIKTCLDIKLTPDKKLLFG